MRNRFEQLIVRCEDVLFGKRDAVKKALACVLARGHLLVEDIPGVGKTTLVKLLAKGLGLSCARIQFTSDLLPADVLGGMVFDSRSQGFLLRKGPIFSNFILADELNRASPKTQSALLQAMEERCVTIDDGTHALPEPFFVFATQNAREFAGTFPLPESQLDRFLMRIALGYPDAVSERALLLAKEDRSALIERFEPQFTVADVRGAQQAVREVVFSPALADYVGRFLTESRDGGEGSGLSPRAGLALKAASQAWAYLEGRDMALPEDVQAVACDVLAHRLGGEVWDKSPRELIAHLVRSVHVD